MEGLGAGRYANISIPRELALRIDHLVKSGSLGYRSRSEFAVEAIRLRLKQVEREAAKSDAKQVKEAV